jgi:hypothetical protein
MRLHVAAPLLGHGLTLGPAPWFKVVRGSLRMGPADAPVGQLENQQWRIGGRFFTAFHLDEQVTVYFETPLGIGTKEMGPFDEVEIRDTTLYADERAIANFDAASSAWRCADDGTEWPILVVSSTREG